MRSPNKEINSVHDVLSLLYTYRFTNAARVLEEYMKDSRQLEKMLKHEKKAFRMLKEH